MTQNLRDTMPPVPEGKVRLADCGAYPPELDATHTLIAQAVGALHGYPTVTLKHVTRGYVIAGSMVRWSEARWSVLYTVHDGGIHGRSFSEASEDKARAYFAELTDSEAVSRRRQEDAMLEDTIYRPAREEAARRKTERDAEEKARKAARRKALRARRLALA